MAVFLAAPGAELESISHQISMREHDRLRGGCGPTGRRHDGNILLRHDLGRGVQLRAAKEMIEMMYVAIFSETERAVAAHPFDAVEPSFPRTDPTRQGSDNHVLQRATLQRLQDKRRQQIEREYDVTAGCLQPLVDLFSHHERTEL